MSDFKKGPATLKHAKILDDVLDSMKYHYGNYEMGKLSINHDPETGLTFCTVDWYFHGKDNPLLSKHRHFMIKRGGQLKLLSSKFKSKKKTVGLINVLYTEI